ncbi:bis(5'-adenosyl)-triphosphatase enpp4 [Brienomyrus brachyistius]|uniref:bis(5'-adenosyl)-triphosphatase enpp4 n=1 Tax=Brienomyrus brachyistius TaxID=42636 RepID=UPI0020B242CD|nr:bis(5'-adenosyl)-triphosphatase enpp4 [Brienomyrus brachyistius]XP_048842182.1 bis(5'-adenosyl)-triphosphatase enpp4 [Brienomyrus brachyistius]XP_048842183.1 bis(5'-adenosyl)-triphosphatase enpp4 [Brienomyrus brachyistius]
MAPYGLMFAFAAWSSMVTITQAANESHAGNASAAILPLLLVSFDGFRADYLEKYPFPNLREFHSDGVLVDHLTNVFITKTFPNHYSLVTGLYAESHGILSSTMYDPVMNRTFSVHNHSTDAVWWNKATPIWVSVQNSGYKTAAAMWPGTDVAIQNKTPTYFMKYDSKVSFRDRVVNLTNWLVRDEAVKFAVLYWEEPDSAGHTYGPDNVTEMKKALKEVDDNIGFLMEQLKSKGLWDKINVIVTSDHGMAQCSPDRLIQLDKCLKDSAYTLVDETPVAAILPRINDSVVFKNLSQCHPNMKAYMKTDIPDRLHYKNNVRIQPIILVADEGWTIVQNEKHLRLGDHGYDNSLPSMHPFLAAHGPAFRKGYRLPNFNSVDIYPLMCHLLGISEKPNNGSFSNTRCLLASESCLDLASVIGIVIGSLMVLTTVTCLFIFIRNRVPASSRPFARLELQEDDDDDPLID